MKKITIVGDVHWSETSSIISGTYDKCGKINPYTDRLNRLIRTINWCEEQSVNSDMIIYLGDFFDKSTVTDMEITALNEISWNKSIPHYLVVGNHEWGRNIKNNSANILAQMDFIVVDTINKIDVDDGTELCFYPYTKEQDRQSLEEYFGKKPTDKNRIIVSHNEIKGIRYGSIVSTSGVNVDEIENNCSLFLNGHLHNGSQFCNNGYNVGNICGQNFLEDALVYKHQLIQLFLPELTMLNVENPYAYNFYKIDANERKDLDVLFTVKKHSVVRVKCKESLLEDCRDIIKDETNNGRIDYSRVIVVRDQLDGVESEVSIEDLHINHLDEFDTFIHLNIGVSDIVDEELNEVLK